MPLHAIYISIFPFFRYNARLIKWPGRRRDNFAHRVPEKQCALAPKDTVIDSGDKKKVTKEVGVNMRFRIMKDRDRNARNATASSHTSWMMEPLISNWSSKQTFDSNRGVDYAEEHMQTLGSRILSLFLSSLLLLSVSFFSLFTFSLSKSSPSLL